MGWHKNKYRKVFRKYGLMHVSIKHKSENMTKSKAQGKKAYFKRTFIQFWIK